MTVEIPQPIGVRFCHRHRNGKLVHHETVWQDGRATCKTCGIEAIESQLAVNDFFKDDFKREVLTSTFVE